jgi:transcriptional regulator GlxA family with amidase domain
MTDISQAERPVGRDVLDRVRASVSGFPPRTLGALVYSGFQALDLWGPLEVFGDCAPAIEPVLVGLEPGPVASAQGPRAMAEHSLESSPRVDLLLVPGGDVTPHLGDARLQDWLRTVSLEAEIVMSVCNGAAILADSGVLQGRRATTNKALFGSIAASYPEVTWVTQARWVEDGKFVTSSGVSAGIDMALAVIAHLAGEQTARALATWIEYEPHRDSTWDPFAAIYGLADEPDEKDSGVSA